MKLPFSPEAFLGVFARYNEALWPAAAVLWLAAAGVLAAIVLRPRQLLTDQLSGLLLMTLWAWAGGVYHARYFTAINPAAWVFAAFFLVEAGLLAWFAVVRRTLAFGSASSGARAVGVALALYALAYPGVNVAWGHAYPATPTFGVPCPTTILTVGMLLTCERVPAVLTIVPVLWSLLAGSATWSLGVPADVMLIACAPLLAGRALMTGVHRQATLGGGLVRDGKPMFRGRTP
jgi:Family of unknown function (DUF6064)